MTASSSSATLGILRGNGDGTFQAVHQVALSAPLIAPTLIDIDGDGVLDLVTTSFHSSAMAVLLGNGDGSFQPGVEYPGGAALSAPVVADMNRDGRPDVIALDAIGVGVQLGTCLR